MRTLLSILMWFYYALLFIASFIAVGLTFLITFPFDEHRRLPNRVLKMQGFGMLYVNPFWKKDIKGVEKYDRETPEIFVGNHQSFLDLPLAYLLPWDMKWIAKKDLLRIPVVGWLVWLTGHVTVDRKSRSAVKRLDNLAQALDDGLPVMIFPEGTRSLDGNLKRFKSGAFVLAHKKGYPLRPMVLDGCNRALPSHDWRFSFREVIKLHLLDAIDPREFDSPDELKDYTYNVIEKELNRLREDARQTA